MPVIHVHARRPTAPPGLLQAICTEVAIAMGSRPDKVWALWHEVNEANFCRPDWEEGAIGPIVEITCRAEHEAAKVRRMMGVVRATLALRLGCPRESIFIAVHRVASAEVMQVSSPESFPQPSFETSGT